MVFTSYLNVYMILIFALEACRDLEINSIEVVIGR